MLSSALLEQQFVPVCAEARGSQAGIWRSCWGQAEACHDGSTRQLFAGQTSHTRRADERPYGRNEPVLAQPVKATHSHDHRRGSSRRASQTVQLQQPSRRLVPTGEH